ncbi:hypothetical protein [Salibacterium lacus]|uniref:Uncharacterized protein n=1 Tax=Salibacterium lacus TaxID=1898109 RepID=A0ABW5T3R7_9BACI
MFKKLFGFFSVGALSCSFLILPNSSFADGHTDDYCGSGTASINTQEVSTNEDEINWIEDYEYNDSDIKENGYQAEQNSDEVGTLSSFAVSSKGGACSIKEAISTFNNNTSETATHNFTEEYEKSTTYSAEVSAGYKDAFEASLGYETSNTAKESYSTTIDVPPNTEFQLSASASLWSVNGEWQRTFLPNETASVNRPTGHVTWWLDEV